MGGKDRENERKLKEGAGKIERMRENGQGEGNRKIGRKLGEVKGKR